MSNCFYMHLGRSHNIASKHANAADVHSKGVNAAAVYSKRVSAADDDSKHSMLLMMTASVVAYLAHELG